MKNKRTSLPLQPFVLGNFHVTTERLEVIDRPIPLEAGNREHEIDQCGQDLKIKGC